MVGFVVLGLEIVFSVYFGFIAEARCSFGNPIGMELPEGGSGSWGPSWLPPGTRCIYRFPDGSVVDIVVGSGLGDWVGMVLVAAFFAALTYGLAAMCRGIRRAITR